MREREPLDQRIAPIHEMLLHHRRSRIVPFDVPGHKQGRGNPALRAFLGDACLSVDVNSSKPLDNLAHPTGAIRLAEELAAEAFGADHAFFMVNGTTSAVQAMIMDTIHEGDTLILPRNVHKSSLNSLVLTGGIPAYVNPGIHPHLGIPLGMALEDVVRAMDEHPEAKAVLVNNPTYYGVCPALQEIIRIAHERGMRVLADEAHGTHLYFGPDLPPAAIRCGADLAAVSVHKTGGSLTQSSMLLARGDKVNPDHLRTTINLIQTTSASYLLMASLDLARRTLATEGREIFGRVLELARYARAEVNAIGGYHAFARDIVNGNGCYAFDETKLSIHTLDIGLAGIEVHDILREEYGIQIEFGDLGNILAILSMGDNEYAIERLASSLAEIRRRFAKDKAGMLETEYIAPDVVATPKQAYYAESRAIGIHQSPGCISSEFVMCYPPGIPIIAPGERITQELVDHVLYSKAKGCLVTGAEDLTLGTIRVMA
ncbi:MAG: aminotransferase class I/II-fold pyridoxal phosphate-dependent enzyme [Clostridia bacterium]|nr:aminotransferase class I/II-fold pyridoxal phosphate-dependent enzyme [Clostridia bacterium]